MKKLLLTMGGVFHLLFGVFHIYLIRAIQVSSTLPPENRPLMHVFNISLTLIVLFFAYVSFFCQRDLLTTKLGKSILLLIGLYYLIRAADEFIFFKFSFVPFLPCLLVGGIYVALLILANSREDELEAF